MIDRRESRALNPRPSQSSRRFDTFCFQTIGIGYFATRFFRYRRCNIYSRLVEKKFVDKSINLVLKLEAALEFSFKDILASSLKGVKQVEVSLQILQIQASLPTPWEDILS